MKEVATAPGASAAILDWSRVDEIGAMSEYYRIKIFTDEGKKFADVEVPYIASFPSKGDVTNINARTIHPDGSIVPFDGKVYDKLLYKGSHGVIRAKTFSLADVRPGSILEYHYNVRWSPTLLRDTEWIIQKEIPIEHASFTLTAYDGPEFGSFFTYSGLPPGVVPTRSGTTRNKFALEMSHVPPYREEPYSLPAAQVKPRAAFYYTSSHLRPQDFWDSQPKIWNKEIEGFLSRSRDVSAKAATIVGTEQNPTEKLRKLYDYVQSLKNFSVDSSVTMVEDAKSAQDVLVTNQGGSSFELTQSFVALARSAGFDADVVRVAPRDERFFSEKVPDAEQMNAEAAMVMLDGKPLFLDPGTPHAPFGLLSWEKSNVPAIRITKGGPQWVKTPLDPPSAAMVKRKADLNLDGDTLKGTITVAFFGQEALIRRLRGDDDTARKKAIEDEIKGWFPNGAVLNVKSVDGLSSNDGAVVVNCEAELPGIVSQAGSRLMVPLSVFAASAKNPFAASTRSGILYFHYPRQEEDEVKLTLPPKYAAGSHPPPQSLNAGAFKYDMTIEDHGSELTMKRSEIIDATFIDSAAYAGVRMFFNAATMADQRPVLINPPAQ